MRAARQRRRLEGGDLNAWEYTAAGHPTQADATTAAATVNFFRKERKKTDTQPFSPCRYLNYLNVTSDLTIEPKFENVAK